MHFYKKNKYLFTRVLLLPIIQFLRIIYKNYFLATIMNSEKIEYYMQVALAHAKKAHAIDEVPVGAIIVKDNKIIAGAHNQLIHNSDPTGHAEIIAIREAARIIGNYRLIGCDMFVTLEPCLMCLGAIFNARINSLFFGAYDKKTGACESVLSLASNKFINHHCTVQGGVLERETKALLQKFFKEKRQKKPLSANSGFYK